MSGDPTAPSPAHIGSDRRRLLGSMGAVAAGGGLLALTGAPQADAAVSNATYYSYGPYRLVDTRLNSGGRISGGSIRLLSAFSGLAFYTFAINLTVVSTTGSGFLSLFSGDLATRPNPYSSINWQGDGKVVANFTMLDLGASGAKVYCSGDSTTSTHFVIDAVGFLYTGGAARATPPGFDDWDRKTQRRLKGEQTS